MCPPLLLPQRRESHWAHRRGAGHPQRCPRRPEPVCGPPCTRPHLPRTCWVWLKSVDFTSALTISVKFWLLKEMRKQESWEGDAGGCSVHVAPPALLEVCPGTCPPPPPCPAPASSPPPTPAPPSLALVMLGRYAGHGRGVVGEINTLDPLCTPAFAFPLVPHRARGRGAVPPGKGFIPV